MKPVTPDYVEPSSWRDEYQWQSSKKTWQRIRKLILVRDDYGCQHCGFRSDKWQVVHHINGVPDDMNPENLETVCIMCSMIHHSGLSSAVHGVVQLYEKSNFDQNTITYFTRSLRGDGIPDREIVRFLGLASRKQFRMDRDYLSGLFAFVTSRQSGTWQDAGLQYSYEIARLHGPNGIIAPLPRPETFDFGAEIENLKLQQPWYFPEASPDISGYPWMSLSPSEPHPSRVKSSYWLLTSQSKTAYPKSGRFSGKWLIFAKRELIDQVWATVRTALHEGTLGSSAKVSTAKPSTLASDPEMHVVCVYTYDWRDREDVRRVANALRAIGISWTIRYKADEDTLSGKYSSSGNGPVCIYAQYGDKFVIAVPGIRPFLSHNEKDERCQLLRFHSETRIRNGNVYAKSLHFAGDNFDSEVFSVNNSNVLATFMAVLNDWARKGFDNVVHAKNLQNELYVLLRGHEDFCEDFDEGHVLIKWPMATMRLNNRGICSGTVIFGKQRKVKLVDGE